MFTSFDRELLLKEVANLKLESTKSNQNKQSKINYSNIFISEGDLPERFTLILKKFDDHFVFKQSKHIIDLQKGDSLLDKFLSDDLIGVGGVLVNMFESLKSERYEKYRTKTGNLMVPCLVDIDYFCPICNFIQTMRTIASQDISILNDRTDTYELVNAIHQLSELILQTFYKIDNFVFVGLIYDEQLQSADIKIFNSSHRFFNSIVGKLSEYIKENGLLPYELDYIGFKVIGNPIDKYNYEVIDVQSIIHNQDVIDFTKQKGIYQTFSSYVNEWSSSRVKSILHKKAYESDVDSDFSDLINSSIETIVDIIKERLAMSQ